MDLAARPVSHGPGDGMPRGRRPALLRLAPDDADTTLADADTLLVPPDARRGLTPAVWRRLEAALAALPVERQTVGDIAEHDLDVGLVLRYRPTRVVGGAAAARVLAIVESSPMRDFMRGLLGTAEPPVCRRVQLNRMRAGDSNDPHRDLDDDPRYTAAFVFYLTDPASYRGGELFVAGCPDPIKPPARAVVCMRADVMHGLSPVIACDGTRDSLVVLVGRDGLPNPRHIG